MPAAPLFRGCAAALITPFLPGGALDEDALRTLLRMQMDAKMDAVILLGTTGEASTLTMAERERVIAIGLETIGSSMPVIVGTGANDTRKAIEYARQAKSLGAHGQLTVTPYYNKATQSGLIRHFHTIADSADLPMILYNVPSRTGMHITPKTAAALAAHPGIAGIKEASGDISSAMDILHASKETLPMYSGNDDMILPLMAAGACGAISVCANITPALTRAITESALAGDYKQARDAQNALLPLIRALFSQVNPIPVKAALSMMDIICDELRLPLTPMEEPFRSQLTSELKALKLIRADLL